MNEWWRYENLESGLPYDWSPATRGDHPDDQIDFHVDLGCGTVPKARLGIDRFEHESVGMILDLNDGYLPFSDDSIESMISHHALEHIGDGFIPLMDECYRVLKPGGIFRIIVPCFPSFAAITDPDHKRYFTPETFQSFIHNAGPETPFWSESFSVPYTSARFKGTALDYTKAQTFFNEVNVDALFREAREIRVTLEK